MHLVVEEAREEIHALEQGRRPFRGDDFLGGVVRCHVDEALVRTEFEAEEDLDRQEVAG